ncbi:MAG: hypothetical protein ACXVI9_14230 [Mucilaginibacter sp.]
MRDVYEIAIYKELGEKLANSLIDSHCDIWINVENLTYTFQNCPKHLVKRILELRDAKGESSILNEYVLETEFTFCPIKCLKFG